MTTFFLMMTLHPQVQRRAQAEIERVVGQDRLANINDQKDLPYVVAVIKEVLRWAAIVPQGITISSPLGIQVLIFQHKVYHIVLPKMTHIKVSEFQKERS